MLRVTSLVLFVLCLTTAWPVDYTLHDLGLGKAYDVNMFGEICGSLSQTPPQNGYGRAFTWAKTDGFHLVFPDQPEDMYSGATSINDYGDIAGYRGFERGFSETFRFDRWGYDIVKKHHASFIGIRGLNNNRFATGSYTQGASPIAYLWDPDYTNPDSEVEENVYPLVPPYGIPSGGQSINNLNQVVGWAVLDGRQTPYIWSNNTGMVAIGSFPSDVWASAEAINDNGQVVGYTGDQAWLWSSTEPLVYLGNLGGSGRPTDINNMGWAVGYSQISAQGTEHAFLWTNDSGMVDIATPFGLYGQSRANAINDIGWIVGSFVDSDGFDHIALWEPVPEPSLIPFAISTLCLLRLRRRRHSQPRSPDRGWLRIRLVTIIEIT